MLKERNYPIPFFISCDTTVDVDGNLTHDIAQNGMITSKVVIPVIENMICSPKNVQLVKPLI